MQAYKLPTEYIDFINELENLAAFNDFNELIFISPDQIPIFNRETLAEEVMPKYTIFATNGAGTALAFKKETSEIYAFELAGMSEGDEVFVTSSFKKLLSKFNTEYLEYY